MCGVWSEYDVAGIGGGEFTLWLIPRQKVAPLYWRSDTHTHMMPLVQLALMLGLTNARLATKEKQEMTRKELLRWIGMCTLITSINFCGARCKLWEGGGAISKYLPSYNLCATGMSCNHFEDIWSAVKWSCQPPEQPDGILLEQYCWMLADNFVANINKYRWRSFYPGNHFWAKNGKIQNLADVASGIMPCLKVMKSATKEKGITAATATSAVNNDDTVNESRKGTKDLLELMEPWHHSDRLVTANAYFASIKATLKLKEKDHFLIGNVKQCNRRFPMEVLGYATLTKQGL
jgi:hypothetical protein